MPANNNNRAPSSFHAESEFWPRAGLVWRSDRSGSITPLRNRRVTKQIRFELQDCLRKLSTDDIDFCFAIFVSVAYKQMSGLKYKNLLEWINDVKMSTPWSIRLRDGDAFELLVALATARQKWHKSPREPFKREEQCETARVLDHFIDGMRDMDLEYRLQTISINGKDNPPSQARKIVDLIISGVDSNEGEEFSVSRLRDNMHSITLVEDGKEELLNRYLAWIKAEEEERLKKRTEEMEALGRGIASRAFCRKTTKGNAMKGEEGPEASDNKMDVDEKN